MNINTRAHNYAVRIEYLSDIMDIKNDLNSIVSKYQCNMIVFCKVSKQHFNRLITEIVIAKIPYEIVRNSICITIGYICFRVRRSVKFHYNTDVVNKIKDKRAQGSTLKEISGEMKIPITSLRNIIKEQII